MMLAHLHELAHASDLPLNADFEAGYADDLGRRRGERTACVETGVAGMSIEDGEGRKLYSVDDAVARLRAARAAIDKAGGDVLLVGRAECFLCGRPDLDETIARLKAYANAGADCLYAPGIKSREQIAAVVNAVAPKPVNVLMSSGAQPLTVADLAALGVRRISVGGALARVGWGAVMRVAKQIAGRRPFRRPQRQRAGRGTQCAVPRRPQEAHTMTELPVGPPVDTTPAHRPGPVVLEGRYGRLEKLGPQHAAALWDAVRGHDHIWTYMSSYGPFADGATFADWVASRAPLEDPYLLCGDRSIRRCRRHRDVDGHPPGGALGRGRPHRLFAGLAAHSAWHRSAIPAGPLRLRDARQSPLRMEMQCAQCRLPAGGAALRFRVRGRVAPA